MGGHESLYSTNLGEAMRQVIPITVLVVGILVGLAGAPAVAQTTLSGRVLDASNDQPLAGANVSVQGTAQGTSVDLSGAFSIDVDALPLTLVVSFVGYVTSEVSVETDAELVVRLTPTRLELEDLVIVGNRFAPRTVIDSPVPIDNIRAAELLETGHATFDKMLTYAVPAFNSTQQTISDATAHFDPADLRGLGPSRTLVLINGKRKSYSSLVYINDTPGKGEVGVDMKSIPSAAIERVEVLRDGASAQYGSDAIAGVINVILKDDVEETNVHVFSGTTIEGDGVLFGYDVNTGFSLGNRGFLNLTHSFSDQDETRRSGEPCAGGADPETCDGLFGGLLGLVTTPEAQSWVRAHPDLGMHVGQPNMTTADIFYNGAVDIANGVELYGFGGLTFRKGLSYALHRTPYWIPDPFNLHHDPGRTYDGFQPTFETSILDNTFAVGARGRTKGWDFDVSNTRGSNAVDYLVDESLNTDLGAQSPTRFNVGGYAFSSNVINVDLARRIDQVQLAFGSEFRNENFVAKSGEEASYAGSGTQSFPGLSPLNEADEIRYNFGVYGDLGVDVTDDLYFGAAMRFENYSDFGSNTSWKVNSRLRVGDNASIRAAASTGFRAPSLHQIHLSIIQTLLSGGTVSNQGTFNNHSPALKALDVPLLKEEEAFNATAGIAVRPVPGLYLSVDAYMVNVDDRIVYSSSIATDDATSAVGQIQERFSITSLKFFTNAVDTQTRGLDVVMNYEFDTGIGDFGINLGANVNDTKIQGQISTPRPIAEANVEILDRKEQSRILSARPGDKVILGFTYESGAVRAALNNTRFGTVTWQHESDASYDQTFAAKVVTDLTFGIQLSRMVRLGVSVNNLLNVYPDEIETRGGVIDPNVILTNLGGRFRWPWEVNQFGFNGTTIMARLNLTL